MGRFRLTLVLELEILTLVMVTLICAVAATAAQQSVANDYPPGDARHCLETARKNGHILQKFQVLPVFGWDNLRNLDQGQVVSLNYSTCWTTDDGRFLLPDGVRALPTKSSAVSNDAVLITQWKDWKSSSSRSINVEVGLFWRVLGISGKFSVEFQKVKSNQIKDRSLTTRAQIRYVRYHVRLQPDTPLHPAFKNRVLRIAAAVRLNQTAQAEYLSQLLVRDFGTHVVTRMDAGAALVKEDQLQERWVMNSQRDQRDILVAASLSLFSISKQFGISASYNGKVDTQFMEEYLDHTTSSSTLTRGGPTFRPGYTHDQWAEGVDTNLVALDRGGDPLYFLVRAALLPELPQSVLRGVYDSVKGAVEAYYEFNRHPGCMDPSSLNFSPLSNVDDGSCGNSTTKLSFGGIYRMCKPGLPNKLCNLLAQRNNLTGGFSCPAEYKPASMTDPFTTITWCYADGAVPFHPGYLFGGVYAPTIDNPVTRSKTCPPHFSSLTLGGYYHICVSDNVELGQQYSVPFGGFFTCNQSNPLAVSPDNRDPQQAEKCPEGYAHHLSLWSENCHFGFCLGEGAPTGPILPTINRPPFIPAPPPTKEEGQERTTAGYAASASQSSSEDGLSAGVVAGIAVGAVAVCIVLIVLAVLAVRAKRSASC